jgi:hypothetical protein
MSPKKVRGKMNIVTAVSFDTLSQCGLKIAIAHTVGSTVTVTSLGSIAKDGMNFIPSRALRKMLETNGQKATEELKESGND